MWLHTITVLLLVQLFVVDVYGCSLGCVCRLKRVECRRRMFHRFPQGVPADTIYLDLRDNLIRHISRSDLRGLPHLQTLLLSNNCIQHIEENILDVIPKLRRLSLSRNFLKWLPKLSSVNPNSLTHFDAHSNRIELIDAATFRKSSEIHSINLAANKIQTLPDCTFANLPHLRIMHLEENPLNCDCRWRVQIDYLRDRVSESPICFNPKSLRDKFLMDVPNEQLKCHQVEVLSKQQGNTILYCNHRIINRVAWLYKGLDMKQSYSGDYELFLNGTMRIDDPDEIRHFECAIDHSVLPQRKRRQLHTSSFEPQFTLRPQNRAYREGDVVRVDCEVIGKPRPKIKWYFNKVELRPSSKHEMNFERTNLIIRAFTDRDVGEYSCVAENVVGRIEASASIELIASSPPVIAEGPESQTVDEGATVHFKCKAKAQPRPAITWFFEGSEISMLRGHFHVSDDESELTVSRVTKQDDGTYSCMAGNAVGSMLADARLTVIPNPQISRPTHHQQLSRPSPPQQSFRPTHHHPQSSRPTHPQQSSHPTHHQHRQHQQYQSPPNPPPPSYRQSITNSITDDIIRDAVHEASQNVDRALDETHKRLSKTTSPRELMQWIRFSLPYSVELNRAREIYEESIRLVQKHVEKGLSLPLEDLPSNVSFASVLTRSHVDLLTQLAGCSGTQTRDPCRDQCYHSRYRTFDGQCNNEKHPMWGSSHTRFRRLLRPIYENGFNTPVGWDPNRLYFGFKKPNPRLVSQKLLRAATITPHETLSAMVMQWGQFIDHDLDFTATAISRNAFATGAICNRTCENINPCFNIQLPEGDPRMLTRPRPKYPCIELERSAAVCGSGETSLIYRQITYREQMNTITSYLDASGIYGSTEEEAYELRDLYPDRGLLRFDLLSDAQKPYLPFELDSPMDCHRNRTVDNPIRCFLAGDYRANEQLGLTAMHTIFLREHNRIAAIMEGYNPGVDSETIFQETRKIVGAQMQHITFYHWLPKVLGQDNFKRLIGPYRGYYPEIDASISNEFATAAFRFGHTLINPVLYRLNADFKPIREGHVSLRDAFFAPETFLAAGGIDPLLRGLFASPMKKPLSEELLNKELTEQLFHRAYNLALDLASLNIQRGRDHGLPGYAAFRKWCNLSAIENWNDLDGIIPVRTIAKLKQLYGHPGNIDLYAGGVSEKRIGDALTGPTFSCIIAEQFNRVRAGDRFWYEREGVFTDEQRKEIQKTTLARIVCDNADSIQHIQEDIFKYVGKHKTSYGLCAKLPFVNLNAWRSCCDQQCSISQNRYRFGNRRRRTHRHDCTWEGIAIKEGERWRKDCSECECENYKVLCRVIDHCQ